MKITSEDIARSFLDTCRSLPEAEHGAVAEAAIHLLYRHGLSRAVRTFPRTVKDMLTRSENIVFARLATPTDDAAAAGGIVAVLERELGKTVALTHTADPSLIGGALLSVGDERFDASLRGALAAMQRQLSTAHVS